VLIHDLNWKFSRSYVFMTLKKIQTQGFTLIELLVAIGMLSILAMVAAPQINNWLPSYRLKAAASNLQANMQKARIQAIKENRPVQMRFDNTANPGFYYFDTTDDDVYTAGEFRVDLSTYKSGVDFGSGNAVANWNGDPCAQATAISFGTRGTANQASVYLQNESVSICYAITTSIAGTAKIRLYNGVNTWIE
jgi:prepilin-type N-terminal cleavage/methylation domain-containing protein